MTEFGVRREELVSALVEPEEADLACRPAVSAGAYFQIWRDEVSVEVLTRIYNRRVRQLTARSIASVGSTVVGCLRAAGTDVVRLGLVHSDAFNFNVFLDPGQLSVLACIGVAVQQSSA